MARQRPDIEHEAVRKKEEGIQAQLNNLSPASRTPSNQLENNLEQLRSELANKKRARQEAEQKLSEKSMETMHISNADQLARSNDLLASRRRPATSLSPGQMRAAKRTCRMRPPRSRVLVLGFQIPLPSMESVLEEAC